MNIDEIPTPETDAAYNKRLFENDKSHRIRVGQTMESLERRLTIAREALQASADAGGSFCDLISAQRKAEEALTLTAPKP